MTTERSEGFAPGLYLEVIGRRKWLVVAFVVVFALLGYAYLKARTPMYAASAQLLYTQQTGDTSPLDAQATFDGTLRLADLGSMPSALDSTVVGAQAAQLLAHTDTSAGYSVAGVLQPDTSSGDYSSVVSVKGTSSSPTLAAAVANAYAQAFVDWRRTSAQTQLGQSVAAVQGQLRSYTTPTSRATASYLTLEQLLQNLQLQQSVASGDFMVLSSASVPSVPFSPRRLHTLGYAAVVGLLLGLAFAFMLAQLDKRIDGEKEVGDLLGLTDLGHLPQHGPAATEARQALVDPQGPAADAFRVLRGNLQFVGVEGDVRVLLVSSSIQGEGKSVVACNLAAFLALAGMDVVLVDADLRSPKVHKCLGVPGEVGLSTVLEGRVSAQQALVTVALDEHADGASVGQTLGRRPLRGRLATGIDRKDEKASPTSVEAEWLISPVEDGLSLRVLPAGAPPANPGEFVASRHLAEVVALLADDADVVVIDSPAMLAVGDFAPLATTADGLLFVVNAAKIRRPLLERADQQLRRLPCRTLGFVMIEAGRARRYRRALRERMAKAGPGHASV